MGQVELDTQRETPDCSEGESNLSVARSNWNDTSVWRTETRRAIERDAACFLHQSVSSPCMSAVKKAEGIWLEDLGRAPLHGFSRKFRASHRLRSSAPESGDYTTDG